MYLVHKQIGTYLLQIGTYHHCNLVHICTYMVIMYTLVVNWYIHGKYIPSCCNLVHICCKLVHKFTIHVQICTNLQLICTYMYQIATNRYIFTIYVQICTNMYQFAMMITYQFVASTYQFVYVLNTYVFVKYVPISNKYVPFWPLLCTSSLVICTY